MVPAKGKEPRGTTKEEKEENEEKRDILDKL